MNRDNTLEKLGLLTLAAISTLALAVISVMALKTNALDPNASTLIGVIAGGLIAIGKDIVQAIRGYAMGAQLSKVTDQLAASGPSTPTPPATETAIEGAQQATDAAQDATDALKGDGK